MGLLTCEADEELELLAPNFTATSSHFGRVDTVELVEGGEGRTVTLANKEEFVQELRNWLLTGRLVWSCTRVCARGFMCRLSNHFSSLVRAQTIRSYRCTILDIAHLKLFIRPWLQ